MKALVAILFSLALVLSHSVATAGTSRQLCQSAEPCECADSTCCQVAPSSDSGPIHQIPAPDHSRTQLLAPASTAVRVVLLQLAPAAAPTPLSVSCHVAPVPLFQRDCSYLI